MSHRLATGCMFGYEITELITIDTVGQYHGITGLGINGCNSGTTFIASLKGSITDTANNGGVLRCTDGTHGLTTGDYVSLTGMGDAAHADITRVTVIDVNTFDCDDIAYNSISDTGTWARGSGLTIDAGHGGTFTVSCTASLLSAGTNKNFRMEVAKNATTIDEFVAERKFANSTDLGSVSLGGLLELTGGDTLWAAVKCTTDDTNITVEHINIHMVRV